MEMTLERNGVYEGNEMSAALEELERVCEEMGITYFVDGWKVLPSKVMDLNTSTIKRFDDVYSEMILNKMRIL